LLQFAGSNVLGFTAADLQLQAVIPDTWDGVACTNDALQRIMKPAEALAKVLPDESTFNTSPNLLLGFLLKTRCRSVKHLLMALAWSAPAVVPGHTPEGLDADEAGRRWALVAQRCAVVLSTVLPQLPQADTLMPEVLHATHGAGLPGREAGAHC
jgi:hypothetical protein